MELLREWFIWGESDLFIYGVIIIVIAAFFPLRPEKNRKNRPDVKSCVSVFRQSQDWLVENGAVSGLNPLPSPFPRVRDGMRVVCGVNAAPGVGKP